jgi:hypothetical protein
MVNYSQPQFPFLPFLPQIVSDWPCPLWHQITWKLLMYFISRTKNLFLQKGLFELLTLRQMVFYVPLNKCTQKIWLQCPPATSLFCLDCSLRPTEGGRIPNKLWSAVWRSASQHWNQCPIPCQTECVGGRPSVGSAPLLFFSGSMMAHRSGKIPESLTLY